MNSNLKIIFFLFATIGINAAFATQAKIKKDTIFKKILILGNSITRHQPAPKLGWYGDWGMAASSRDKDFVHILEKKFHEVYKPAVVHFENIAVFERAYWKYHLPRFDSLRSFDPDLIILRIGENVNSDSLKKYNFETHYQSLINYFINSDPRTKILCVSSFWKKDQVDTLIEKASNTKNCYYLKISQLSKDSTNMAVGKFENKGVAMHPSDKGMSAIANLIWEKINLIR
jgi:hypothetical protein